MWWKWVCGRERIQRAERILGPFNGVGSYREDVGFIRRLRARDVPAFKHLVERYQDRVFSFVFHIVGNRDEADTISIGVFAACHSAAPRFKGEREIICYLYQRATALSYSHLKTCRARPSGAGDVQLRQIAIAELLSALNEEEATLLLLRDVEHLSVAELGILFDVDDAIVRATLFGIRQKLIQRSPNNALASHQL